MGIGKKYVPKGAKPTGLMTNEKAKVVRSTASTPKPGLGGIGVSSAFANRRNAGRLSGAGSAPGPTDKCSRPQGANKL